MAKKEEKLKSAFELAMERLEAQDAKQGAKREAPLTPAQKREIERLRQEARAKLAELEILHRKHVLGAASDPAKLAEVEEHYRIDRRRIESHEESAVARVKQGRS
jgi:hypothetical protein